jgi:kynurenine formamidase
MPHLSVLLSLGVFFFLTQEVTGQNTSEWGPKDQKGAANRITPEKILEAAGYIKEGKIYELGHPYEVSMPLGGREFTFTVKNPSPIDSTYQNNFVGNMDYHAGEIGQIGTQFDALGHIGFRYETEDYYYNGITGKEIYSSSGLRKLGVENVGPIVTRGVLIDVASQKGLERLEAGYEITEEDLLAALEAQNTTIREGDVVLIRTGHSKLWKVDNDAFYDWVNGEPGIGISAAKWLANQKVVMVGSDNFGVEVIPFAKPAPGFPVHIMLLKEHGIYLFECLNLEGLAADKVYEFAFVFSPLPVKGATGSPGNPMAIR